MGTIQTLIATFLRRRQGTNESEVIPPSLPAQIADGVDYSMPVLMPRHLRRSLGEGQALTEYLESAGREPFRHQFDSPYATETPIAPVVEDPLLEWSPQTRERVLTNCHAAYARNPLANAIVQYSGDFIIGDGFSLTCKNAEVEEVLYDFIDNPQNAIREYERQASIDVQVDGELLLRVFPGGEKAGGKIRVIPMRPWECDVIRTQLGDFRTPKSFHFWLNETEGDDPSGKQNAKELTIPAENMLHVAINRHAYELRGRPELYRLLPWLRADKIGRAHV